MVLSGSGPLVTCRTAFDPALTSIARRSRRLHRVDWHLRLPMLHGMPLLME